MAARQHRWIAHRDLAGVTTHRQPVGAAEPEDPRLAGVSVLVTRGLATRTGQIRQSRTATSERLGKPHLRWCWIGSAARSTVLQGGVSTVGWKYRVSTRAARLGGAAAQLLAGGKEVHDRLLGDDRATAGSDLELVRSGGGAGQLGPASQLDRPGDVGWRDGLEGIHCVKRQAR